ncbi:hypothetical protein E2C01_031822 [Portunus trituberculatus]|uniref:Uncharacterized protein n=1 Tax=Portunus trituberculatus TaxID=210409 RepID=A0A5B7EYP4_PORTR|nr:hypothetical protein [Portunus trituberculatus]
MKLVSYRSLGKALIRYKVLERHGKVDYVIDEPRGPKLSHVNLIKKYYRRAEAMQVSVLDEIATLEDMGLMRSRKEVILLEDNNEGNSDYSNQLPVTPDGVTGNQLNENPKSLFGGRVSGTRFEPAEGYFTCCLFNK